MLWSTRLELKLLIDQKYYIATERIEARIGPLGTAQDRWTCKVGGPEVLVYWARKLKQASDNVWAHQHNLGQNGIEMLLWLTTVLWANRSRKKKKKTWFTQPMERCFLFVWFQQYKKNSLEKGELGSLNPCCNHSFVDCFCTKETRPAIGYRKRNKVAEPAWNTHLHTHWSVLWTGTRAPYSPINVSGN